jgi:hypothetical protein
MYRICYNSNMSIDLRYYIDIIKYDVLKMPSYFDYSILPTIVDFDSHYDKKRELHWLESKDLPGLCVTGRDKVELAKNVGDTLLVYFDVPTYFAKKYHPDNTTFNFVNQKTGEMEYVSLDYENELKRAAV